MTQGSTKKLPSLNGRAVQIRDLLHIMLDVFPKFMNAEDAVHRDALAALQTSIDMEIVIMTCKGEYRFFLIN